jgi:hypothetical protein
MKRILCSLLIATLPFGSVLGDAPKSENAKVTLVYHGDIASCDNAGRQCTCPRKPPNKC